MAHARTLRISQHFASTILVGGAAAATLYPRRRVAHAESPPKDTDLPSKKPIYSSTPPLTTNPLLPTSPTSPVSPITPDSSTSSSQNQESKDLSPTPTDRLTAQISQLRKVLYTQTHTLETHLNSTLTYLFRQETSLSNTLTSLAPPPQTGETVFPGLIYVLVSTLSGSIISRNRGILLRALTPLGFGLASAWYLLPHTMTNVSDLAWSYETKVPAISETHATIRGFVVEGWRQTRQRTVGVAEWADRTAEEGRKTVEGWVEKGK